MLNNSYKEKESFQIEKIEKICDSPKNKSRITLEYEFNPTTDLLGRGGFGEVYKVKLTNNSIQREYAIKVFDKNNLSKNTERSLRILNEIKIHRSLIHEHICKYEHSFEDNKNVYILMEFCANGNLSSLLKARRRLEEIEIRFYMFQVLLVLKYLRRQKIIHRDLTLKNIFLKDYKTVKIGDFGFAFRENEYDEKSGIICGTPGYYTPESNNCKYNYKTDIFDFGVCIYYLFGGRLPLQTSQESYDLFLSGDLKLEKTIESSEEAIDLLKNTICLESKRLDLDKIFEHPFFKNGKGLSIETFPNYNDKDYKSKINNLSKEMGIKVINRLSKKDIRDQKKKKKKHKRKHRNNSPSYYSSSSSSSLYNSNSNSSSSGGESKSSNKNSHRSIGKTVSFNLDNKDKLKDKNKNENEEIHENQNVRNSLKEMEEFNLKKIEVEEDLKKSINFNKSIEVDAFMKKVYENNYKYYYYFYKNQKKLDGNNLIYIRKVYDNLKEYCGLGYELNNKNIGIIFNDDSQMTKLNDNLKYIFYHQKDKINTRIIHTIINLPPKDVSLGIENKLKFFWQIIEGFKNKKKKKKYSQNKNNLNNNIEDDVYLVKYRKKHKAYFFIFSNGKIQVKFFDGVNIIFSFFPKGVIYISKKHKNTLNIFPLNYEQSLNDVGCEDPIMNSKIKYAIDEIKK